jgi:YD repeat-containing protein
MKRICMAALVAVLFHHVNAQNTSPSQDLKKLTPITPNAASLGKFGEIPVSLYTGIPSISIPLYEIDVNGFKIPISVSYHAGGNKVDDIASWVGLGWTLQAGGVINRQQRGIPDERMLDDYPSVKSSVDKILSGVEPLADALYTLGNSGMDTESDIFAFNLPGYSGKFFLDPDGNLYTIPRQDNFTIAYKDQGRYTVTPGRYSFARWVITDEKGVRYVFGKTMDDQNNYFDISCIDGVMYAPCDVGITINSWHLNEIILPGGQSIKYVYELYNYQIENTLSYTLALAPHAACMNVTSGGGGYVKYSQACRLKEIQYPGGRVSFAPGGARADLNWGDKSLARIVVSALQNGTYKTVKQYDFTYNTEDRLRLDQINEVGTDNKKKPHRFTYNDIALPPRGDKSQDIWGYFNNQAIYGITDVFYADDGTWVPGVNRAVDPEFTQAGMLTKITYPTGGTSEFVYENNTFTCRNGYEEALRTRTKDVELQNHVASISEEFTLESNALSKTFQFTITGTGTGCTSNNGLWDWSCAQLSLERKDNDGVFKKVIFSDLSASSYTLPIGGTYRVVAAWRDEADARLSLRIIWTANVTEANPAFCERLDHIAKYPKVSFRLPVNFDFWNGGETKYSDDFELNAGYPGALPNVKVEILTYYTCGGFNSDGGLNCGEIEIERKNSDGTYSSASQGMVRKDNGYYFLPGTYRVKATYYGREGDYMAFHIAFQLLADKPPTDLNISKGERYGGGLRIRKITDYDNVTKRTVVKTYNYDCTDEDGDGLLTGVSSGILMNVPIYSYYQNYCSAGYSCYGQFFTNQSQANILSQDGINIGYSVVTEEIQGIEGGGKQEVRFSTALDQPDGGISLASRFPFSSTVSYEWRRGKEMRRRVYAGSVVSEQQEAVYTYNDEQRDPNYKKIRCIKLVPATESYKGECLPAGYRYQTYSVSTESFYTSKTREMKASTRDYTTKVVSETQSVQDPVSLQNSMVETTDSEGIIIKAYTKYAVNYSLPSSLQEEAQGIKNLMNYNVRTAPIEQYVTNTGSDGVEYVVGGNISVYASDRPVVHKVYQLKLSKPKALASFVRSEVLSTGVFRMDTDYVEMASFVFNGDLTLKEQSRTADVRKAYLWDGSGQNVIATAENAGTDDIAYTSFESASQGNFTFAGGGTEDDTAPTGRAVYTMTNDEIIRSGLVTGQNYLLSFWYKGGTVSIVGGTQQIVRDMKEVKNGWSFMQVRVTGTTSIRLSSAAARVDEVRVHPMGALLTTYTYKEGIGVSSATDANNRTTFYEYDSFGRLMLVRDYTGEIREKINYQYMNQY